MLINELKKWDQKYQNLNNYYKTKIKGYILSSSLHWTILDRIILDRTILDRTI